MRAWCCKLSFKKIFTPFMLTLVLILLLSNPLYSGTGVDSFAFLKIKTGARGASLGDGFVSVSGDINASSYNPASVATLPGFQLSLMHLAYIADTSYELITLAAPVNNNLSLGVSFTYFNYGSIIATSETGTGIYSSSSAAFTPYDILGAVTAGYKINKNINLGVNVKYVLEDISGVSISGLLADAGFLYAGENLGVGVAVINLGAPVNNEKIPTGVRAGASMKMDLVSFRDLTVLLGGNYGLTSGKTSGSAGVEYCYDEMFFLRGSYNLNTDADTVGVGAGFKSNLEDLIYSLDYNFNMLGDLGSAHRISLTVSFKNESKGKTSQKKPKSTGLRYSSPTRSR